MTYTWTDNPMQGWDLSTVNNDLMHLKYDNVSSSGGKIPYSVNSGKQDSNGYAAFIQRDSDTQITILAGGSNPDLVISYPDGTYETITSDIVISSGLSNNGNYIIVKEKGNNTPILVTGTNIITESIAPASGGNDGDYWLNIGVRPLQPTKKVSGSWTSTQFVKLGEITKTNGVIATPISYAYNGFCIIPEFSTSGGQNYTKSHNIGSDLITIQSHQIYQVHSGTSLWVDAWYCSDFYSYALGCGANNMNKLTLSIYNPSSQFTKSKFIIKRTF